jgi:hypothetical protein
MPSSPPWLGAILVFAIASGVAACASDQPHRPPGGRGFHGEDGGGRGPRAGGGTRLFISPSGQPFRAAPGDPYPVAAWFAAADADHDGRLTRQEFRQDALRFFDQLDANHDGVIDGAEIAVYEHSVAPELLAMIGRSGGGEAGEAGPQGGGGRRGGGMGGGTGRHGRRGQSGSGPGGGQDQPQTRLEGAAPYSLIPVIEPVAAADTDFDGKVRRAEFIAAADRRFEALDTAGAGYLTLASLPRTPVQGLGRRPATGAD